MLETVEQRQTRETIEAIYNEVLLEHSPQIRLCAHYKSGMRLAAPWRTYGSVIASYDKPERIKFMAQNMARVIEDHLHGRNTEAESMNEDYKSGLVCMTSIPVKDLRNPAPMRKIFIVTAENPTLVNGTAYFIEAKFSHTEN